MRSFSSQKRGAFTLVELLVVIGIIALLISILLPSLNNVREQAKALKCLSNVRQLGLATIMFAQEHKGYMPTCSDDQYAKYQDPNRYKFSYRTAGTGAAVFDSYSSLLPYLGTKFSDNMTFMNAPDGKSKIFVCPSDVWQDGSSTAGYAIISNVLATPANTLPGLSYAYFPISYGVNADIACCVDQYGLGRCQPAATDQVSVAGGPLYNGANSPLNCNLFHVYRSSEVLLYGDCGTRAQYTHNVILYQNDALYYSTDYMSAAPVPTGKSLSTLESTIQYTGLAGKVPITAGKYSINSDAKNSEVPGNRARHRGDRINIVFCDGHAEGIRPQDFGNVRISPYAPMFK